MLSLCYCAQGQNLVPNGSFENLDTIPCFFTGLPSDLSNVIKNWYIPTAGSSDIHSTLGDSNCVVHCFSNHISAVGRQAPFRGNAIGGLISFASVNNIPSYREYISVKLKKPLQTHRLYKAEMYVSLADNSGYAANNMGMFFSDSLVPTDTILGPLQVIPQVNDSRVIKDSLNWVKLSGIFRAQGPQQFLTIGNFYSDGATIESPSPSLASTNPFAYYYVDDVSVRELIFEPPKDTVICRGDSVQLKVRADSLIGWAVDSNPTLIISSDSLLVVAPKQKTSYLVYSKWDTAKITVRTYKKGELNLGRDTTLCPGETVRLKGMGDRFRHRWQNGSLDSVFEVKKAGVYWLELDYHCGTLRDTVVVSYRDCSLKIAMPNVFSPNNDQFNDFFRPYEMSKVESGTLYIYNRHGQLLFEGPLLGPGWDGRYQGQQCTEGVYFWQVSIKGSSTAILSEEGFLTLIR